MPKITYIDKNGAEHVLDVPVGYSLMEGAYNAGLAGMEAECGGACACATCHSYIDTEFTERVPPIQDDEDTMLGMANGRKPTSRLTCQIHVTEEMEGVVVRIGNN